jgi:hypothetical protein
MGIMDNLGNNSGVRHPSVDYLVDYIGGQLASLREIELELHLSWCDDCATSASRVRVLSHLVSRWTAAGHRRTAAESRIMRALMRASAAPTCAAWQHRLTRWADWAGRSEAALRVILHQAGEQLQASVSSLAALTRPGALWPEFVPQAALAGALATRGAAQDSDVVVSESADAPRVRVNASGAESRIEIEIEGLPAGPAPLAMLVPEDKEGQLLLGELRPGSEPSRFSAVFEKVGPGRYMLVIEPQAAGEQPPRPADAFG